MAYPRALHGPGGESADPCAARPFSASPMSVAALGIQEMLP